MKQISNNDFFQAKRLLGFLAKLNGKTVKEREASRKAAVLVRKLERKEESFEL